MMHILSRGNNQVNLSVCGERFFIFSWRAVNIPFESRSGTASVFCVCEQCEHRYSIPHIKRLLDDSNLFL